MDRTGQKCCALTGTGGYLGAHLKEYLAGRGWKVYSLSSRPSGANDASYFTLQNGAPPGFFAENKITTLIHCAWDFSSISREEIFAVNVAGSLKLLAQATGEGVRRIIFVSTMSAYDGCRSLYGQAKLEVEKAVVKSDGVIVRPGLIYGEQPRGMVGALTKAIEKIPLIPLIGDGSDVLYLTHEDDLAELIKKESDPDTAAVPAKPIIAAAEHGLPFRDILYSFARLKKKRIHLVPIPWRAVWGALKIGELLKVKLPFRSDSVLSLVTQNPNPDFSATREAGVAFRSFKSYIEDVK